MNICVIGGGAAGISAASMAKRTNPDATVVCYTEYEDVAYSPCGIPYVLAARSRTSSGSSSPAPRPTPTPASTCATETGRTAVDPRRAR